MVIFPMATLSAWFAHLWGADCGDNFVSPAYFSQTRECVSIFGTLAYFYIDICTSLGFKLAYMNE